MLEEENIESIFTDAERKTFKSRYKDIGAGYYDLDYDISNEAIILNQKLQAHVDAIEKLKVMVFEPKDIYHYPDLMRWCHVHNIKAKGCNPIKDTQNPLNPFLFTQIIIKDHIFEHARKESGMLFGSKLYQIAENVQLSLL